MHVTFDHREDVAAGVQTFWFRPVRPVRYTAGQFTEIHLPHSEPDSRSVRRWFTLSSSPTEPLVAITTAFAPTGGSTFKRVLRHMLPGTSLQLTDPMGDFVLPKDPSIPLIFIAGGAGITPIRSMVKFLADTKERRDIRLIYAVTRADELAFLPLFKAYGLILTTVVKKPEPGYTGETGILTPARILDTAGDDGRSYFYLSGPELMVEQFYKELKAMGVHPGRLVTDYFPGYALP